MDNSLRYLLQIQKNPSSRMALEEVIDITKLVFKSDSTDLVLFAGEGKRITQRPRNHLDIAPLEESYESLVIKHGKRILIEDVRTNRQTQALKGQLPDCVTFAAIPIFDEQGDLTGCLSLEFRKKRGFSDDDWEILRLIASRVTKGLQLIATIEESEIVTKHAVLAQDALYESENRFRACVEAMHDGLVLQGADGTIHICNNRATEILGLTEDQLCGRSSIDGKWNCIKANGDPFPGPEHPAMRALAGEVVKGVVMGVNRTDGSLIWIEINSTPLYRSGESKPHASVTTFSDISDELSKTRTAEQYMVVMTELNEELERQTAQLMEANAKLEKLASIDGLTGLLNHRSFQNHLQNSLCTHDQTALLLLDVDHFKSYNDTFGHPAGDQVLREVAQVLLETARPTDWVCRYGGEEFAIVLPNSSLERAERTAEDIHLALSKRQWALRPITVSTGISHTKNGAVSRSELITRADSALYEAKAAGRNQTCTFVPPQDLAA